MSGYILRRVLATIPVMLVVALFVFLMLRLSPGDPAAVIAGDYATAADVERIREKLGLNEPIQYNSANGSRSWRAISARAFSTTSP